MQNRFVFHYKPRSCICYILLKENPVDTLKTKAYAAKAISIKHNQENTLK